MQAVWMSLAFGLSIRPEYSAGPIRHLPKDEPLASTSLGIEKNSATRLSSPTLMQAQRQTTPDPPSSAAAGAPYLAVPSPHPSRLIQLSL
jgi:hypothetical protein